MREFIDWGRLIPEYTGEMERMALKMISRGLTSRQIELMLGIPHNIVDQWHRETH